MEGTLTGSFNETTFFNGVVLDAEEQLALIDKYGGIEELGGFHTAPHFAAAWAHANNTPFQWGKQMASHLGGTRDPMVIAWPRRIAADGDAAHPVHPLHRRRAHHPGGRRRSRSRRSSTASSRSRWTAPASPTPSPTPTRAERHTVQYFEMYGSRAIYKDGWWACTKLDKLPWDFAPATLTRFAPGSGWDPKSDVWELYYLPDDFSQARNIAADHPEKVAELVELFWRGGRAQPGAAAARRVRGVLRDRCRRCRRRPGSPSPATCRTSRPRMIPRIIGRSYAIEADVHIPEGGAEGVLVAFADFIGGFALWVDEKGLLHHTYQFLGVDTYKQTLAPSPSRPATSR